MSNIQTRRHILTAQQVVTNASRPTPDDPRVRHSWLSDFLTPTRPLATNPVILPNADAIGSVTLDARFPLQRGGRRQSIDGHSRDGNVQPMNNHANGYVTDQSTRNAGNAIPLSDAEAVQLDDSLDQGGAGPMFFPFLTVPYWSSEQGLSVSTDVALAKGDYIIRFSGKDKSVAFPSMDASPNSVVKVEGKNVRVNKVRFDGNGSGKIWFTVEENPPMLFVLIPIILASVGLAAWGLEGLATKVDKVVISTTNLAIVAVIGLAVWFAGPRLFGRGSAAGAAA